MKEARTMPLSPEQERHYRSQTLWRAAYEASETEAGADVYRWYRWLGGDSSCDNLFPLK